MLRPHSSDFFSLLFFISMSIAMGSILRILIKVTMNLFNVDLFFPFFRCFSIICCWCITQQNPIQLFNIPYLQIKKKYSEYWIILYGIIIYCLFLCYFRRYFTWFNFWIQSLKGTMSLPIFTHQQTAAIIRVYSGFERSTMYFHISKLFDFYLF